MTTDPKKIARRLACASVLLAALLAAAPARAQDEASAQGKQLYEQLRAVSLAGGAAEARGLVLKRDRAEMTFDGTFYFASPVEGRVTCAVFVGEGKFRAEVPPSDFEKDNVRRLLGADAVESDFKTAVLRFSDDTFDLIGQGRREGVAAAPVAEKLAAETDARILKETGANLSARLALSILNDERPGFFFANFDGGRRGRFSLVLDYQNRIPVANFGIDAGEAGLIFHNRDEIFASEVWTAFYSLEDYRQDRATYADVNNLIAAEHYDIAADVRDPGHLLGLTVRLKARTRAPGLRAVPFRVGENLSRWESERLKKQLRLKSARVGGVASTDDFRKVANEHFAKTPIAQRYGIKNLDWFFAQWVYQTGLPSYRAEYQIEDAGGGAAIVSGDIFQENVPDNWVMPLPLVFTFDENKWASGTVLALGPKTPFKIKLPARPKKVELDPTHWVLSEKTSTEAK
jgi:hypothetical protein